MADVRRAVRDCWDAFAAQDAAIEPSNLANSANPANPASASGLESGDLILVACSGGADSMALAEAVAFEAPRWNGGLRFGAVIVEHGLQAETKAVAEQTASALVRRGFEPVTVKHLEGGELLKSRQGTEAAAREARYEVFESAAEEFDAKAVMLGHTLDDQAETVLLGLARGSGPRSMAGMREIASSTGVTYLRPLLKLSRETTVAACRDAGIKFWVDPMNLDPHFARVRVRQSVLPLLEEQLGPGIAEALSRTADIAREDSDYLDSLCSDILKGIATYEPTAIRLPADLLAEQPPAIRNRILHQALTTFHPSPTRAHVLAVVELVTNWHGQKPLALPGIRVSRTGGEIHLKSAKTLKPGAC